MTTNDFWNITDNTECEHENWLVPIVTHIHEGDGLDIFFYCGHNMIPFRQIQIEGLYVYAITPEGMAQQLEMSSNYRDSWAYRLVDAKRGFYNFVSQNTEYYSEDGEGKRLKGTFKDNPDAFSATRYVYYAHMILRVGHDLINENCTETPPLPLKIVPVNFNELKMGDIFFFTLFSGDRVLPLYDINMAYTTRNGETVQETLVTDGDGRIAYPITTPGRYLVIVRYSSSEEESDAYYDTSYTYTYWFKVTT